jgi:hypothetical protein
MYSFLTNGAQVNHPIAKSFPDNSLYKKTTHFNSLNTSIQNILTYFLT